jgi:acetylornithine/N-succinyldiaminopimelate aminotransferase
MEHGSSILKAEVLNSSALLNVYSRFPVEFEYGNGAYLYDKNGTEYLDFLSGIAVNGFGHNHPEIKKAVLNQINKLWHVSNLYESSPQEKLAHKLLNISGLDSVFFCNSGTEAIEAAIKFARKFGKNRTNIISALGGFHGRTYGSLSATGQEKLQAGFGPMLEGFTYVEFGNISKIEEVFTEKTIAVLIEPIQGEAGIIAPPENYLKDLRDFCDKKNILLIVDEIQSGNGRTGKYFAYQHEDLLPDIITAAKGLANGLPLGAVICSQKISSTIEPGNHGSTFGGNPVAVAAANKVIELIDDELLENVKNLGALLKDSIAALHLFEIEEVRGKGLMLGIKLSQGISAKEIAKKLLEKRVLVGTSGDEVIRILPPLIISQKEIILFLIALREVIFAASNNKKIISN